MTSESRMNLTYSLAWYTWHGETDLLVLLEEKEAKLSYAGCAMEQILRWTLSGGRWYGMQVLPAFLLYYDELRRKLKALSAPFFRTKELPELNGFEEYLALLIPPSKTIIDLFSMLVYAVYRAQETKSYLRCVFCSLYIISGVGSTPRVVRLY